MALVGAGERVDADVNGMTNADECGDGCYGLHYGDDLGGYDHRRWGCESGYVNVFAGHVLNLASSRRLAL